jgi:hypothetical protein
VADVLDLQRRPESADRLLAAIPKLPRTSSVSAEVRAAGRDLDWARLARRFGHTVQTMQREYTYVVDGLRNVPRRSVAEQVADARAAVGPTSASRRSSGGSSTPLSRRRPSSTWARSAAARPPDDGVLLHGCCINAAPMSGPPDGYRTYGPFD